MDSRQSFQFYIERGDDYFRQSNFEGAINCYKKAVKHHPQSIIAYLRIGDANKAKGYLDVALLNYKEAKRCAGSSKSTIYRKMGNVYFLKEQFDRAIACYKLAIKLKPHRACNYKLLADVYLEQDKLVHALNNYTKAIERGSKSFEAYVSRGEIYLYQENNYPAALADCNKAISLNPRKNRSYLLRAGIHAVQGNFAASYADCDLVIRTEPRCIEAYWIKGILYTEEGRNGDAIHNFNKVIELDPNEAEAYFSRASVCMCVNFSGAALFDFHKAVMLDPHNLEYKTGFKFFLKAHTKAHIFEIIKRLPEEKSIELLDQIVQPQSCLGKKFKPKTYLPPFKFFSSVKRMQEVKQLRSAIHAKQEQLQTVKRNSQQTIKVIAQGCADEQSIKSNQFTFFSQMPLEIAAKIAAMTTDENLEKTQAILGSYFNSITKIQVMRE